MLTILRAFVLNIVSKMRYYRHSTFSKLNYSSITLGMLTCQCTNNSSNKPGNCSSQRISRLKNQQSFPTLKKSSRICRSISGVRWRNPLHKSKIRRIKTSLTTSTSPEALRRRKKIRHCHTHQQARDRLAGSSKTKYFPSPWIPNSSAENLATQFKTHIARLVSL